MRRRRYRQNTAPTQNLDSFLDILTNTVGVLMFIGLFVSLLTVETDTVVRTPLVSDSQKNPYFLEVRDNEVFYLDKEAVDEKIQKYSDSLPSCEKPEEPSVFNVALYEYYLSQLREYRNCVRFQSQRLMNFQTLTSNYTVSFGLNSGGLVFRPRETVSGESPKQLSQEDSEFQTILKNLNPQTDYLAFLVRPDSFSTFRRAREVAGERNFDVGWEPMKADTAIVFGSGGRSIGVQ